MKQIYLFIFLIGFTTCTYAQFESSTKFKSIPPATIKPKPEKKETPPPTDFPVIIPPNVYKNPNPPNAITDYKLEIKSEISMIPKNEFINPGDEIRDKLNKKTDRQEGIAYRRNQSLGTYKTTSVSAQVMYRDAQFVDGDLIRVYLNGVVIQSQVYLDSNFKGFEIALQKGFNKIDFEALNQGDSGPNTAEFRVYDDDKKLVSASEWNLGTGFKATIILVKE
ncbi:hypothetical protein [Flavobacterium taihuense]|uniref:Secreted protein n=1 Tax=Flavobacterium taihuense TaxID=2857508 RepID=A0ABS6XTH5_9FLAO|nr:hypothetical protein [Flavobacterium taihuense]MBW4359969.1 hypothetical protein [Flavobacterium taihuense]